MKLRKDDAIAFADRDQNIRWGVVLEVVPPFVLLRGATWTYESRVTVRAKNKELLQAKLKSCTHPVSKKNALRRFCVTCGRTLKSW